jgi:hypothetical protein
MTVKERIDIIITATCMELDIDYDELVSKVRSARLVRARAIVSCLVSKYTNLKDERVAKVINKDRTTVIYYRELIRDASKNKLFNKLLSEELQKVQSRITLDTSHLYNISKAELLIKMVKDSNELDFNAIMAQYLKEIGYEN